ncbi:MAG: Crp/Fnr family transcriptional regulator [Treponemataceae bacterium]
MTYNLHDNPLFKNIETKFLPELLTCLGAFEKKYLHKDLILHEGDEFNLVGFILDGAVQLCKNHYSGYNEIITEIKKNNVFAESFVCTDVKISPFSVIVSSDSAKIMFFSFEKMMAVCSKACFFHLQLIENFMKLIAEKNLLLQKKNTILAQRTTRDKLLTYLELEIAEQKTKKIVIPYNRNELADFLCVDRSALSRELSVMKKEKLLSYDGRNFERLN